MRFKRGGLGEGCGWVVGWGGAWERGEGGGAGVRQRRLRWGIRGCENGI